MNASPSKLAMSLIIPAFNEENYLPATLAALDRAKAFLEGKRAVSVELIVVDNNSTDRTAQIANDCGAQLIREVTHNIATVRNSGARAANGRVLVFVDADTIVPMSLLLRIAEAMSNPNTVGGAVDTMYRSGRPLVTIYLQLWRLLGKLMRMAQGATQFYERETFFMLGGYDETMFMGEDVDLFWRLRRLARRTAQNVRFISDVRVIPSTRRFELWPLWRTLLWTNPLYIAAFRYSKTAWSSWYSDVRR